MRESIEHLTRDKDESLALARVLDLVKQAKHRGEQAGDFLEPRMQQLVSRLLTDEKNLLIDWQGGYASAERCRLVLHTPMTVPEPQVAFIKVQAYKGLQHRDCLGSLLGMGLRREKVGDLLPVQNLCYIIVAREIAEFVVSNLTQVGKQDVQTEEINNLDGILSVEPKIVVSTVASLRLDAIIAAGFGVSRSEAQSLVTGEKVKLNYLEDNRPDRQLTGGDLVSVRGYGRLKLVSLGGKSRKDRFRITLERY